MIFLKHKTDIIRAGALQHVPQSLDLVPGPIQSSGISRQNTRENTRKTVANQQKVARISRKTLAKQCKSAESRTNQSQNTRKTLAKQCKTLAKQ